MSQLHYVAVNARTKEAMGSVPIHMPKLLLCSGIVEAISAIAMMFVDWRYNWLFLLIGLLYSFLNYSRYRNSGASHEHESETKSQKNNLEQYDQLLERRTGLRNAYIEGANNRR